MINNLIKQEWNTFTMLMKIKMKMGGRDEMDGWITYCCLK